MARPTARQTLAEVASILRLHIIGVAVAAALVFGWLLTGSVPVGVALLGGVDWLLINLLNKITDLEEDRVNEIRGSERVERHRRLFSVTFGAVLLGSFAASALVWPELLVWRLIVQLIGLGYSLPLVPTPSGFKRFKAIYFLKNFMSAVLFVLTVFIYPLAANAWVSLLPGGTPALALLIGFFVAFELTYEILYDMRDLDGDAQAGVPTYPVVHGVERARQIIDGLLVLAVGILVVGLAARLIGLREGLMLAAPVAQFAFYRPRYQRGLTSADCVRLTHLGTALLIFYLAGNQLWLRAGLPDNVFFG